MFQKIKLIVANKLMNLARVIASEPEYTLRVELPTTPGGTVYTKIVPSRKPFEGYKPENFYNGAAFFTQGISEELGFHFEVEDGEEKDELLLNQMRVHTRDAMDRWMENDIWRRLMATVNPNEGAINQTTLQYIMLGLIGIILVILVTQFI